MRRRDAKNGLMGKLFADVEPLQGRDRQVPPRRRRARPPTAASSASFEIERWGEHVEGVAAGAAAGVVSRLHHGDVEPDLRVDLHGLDEEGARQVVRQALRRATRAGLRAVLVIHGRGRPEAGGSVLKQALPGWLAEAPHGGHVVAFSTAGPHGARGGATLVLLDGRR